MRRPGRLARTALLILAAITGLAPLPRPARAADATIRVDASQHYQRIHGWEATVNFDWDPAEDPLGGAILDGVVALGINRLRVGIFCGTESDTGFFGRQQRGELPKGAFRKLRYTTRNDNDDPFTIDPKGFDFANLDRRIDTNVLPMRQRLAARGEHLFVNVNYVCFTGQTDGLEDLHVDPEEYAEFVLATYLHMQEKYGFVPDAWEVILEPDTVREWSRDPALIGRAMVAAAARLRAAGFTPRFIAPSVMDMSKTVRYLDAIVSVPGARDLLFEVSYHRYRGGKRENLAVLAARAAALGLDTAMLELWFDKADQEVLQDDLKIGNNAAWQSGVVTGYFRTGEGRPVPKDITRYVGQYTSDVREGAERIGAGSTLPDAFDPVAFVNADGSTVVVVKAKRGGTLRIEGLPAGRYRVSGAVAEGSFARPEPVTIGPGQPLEATIPAAGVLTVTSRQAPY